MKTKNINNEKQLNPFLPSGVKDILPFEARELKTVKRKIAKSFESWGYDEVFTPAFEYLDISSLQSGERIKKEMFKFIDDSGDLLALRPDMTTSIARLVSQKMSSFTLPLRLFYQSNVFRQQKPLQGQPREFWQSGVELFGGSILASDTEIIMLLIDTLKSTGLKNFKVGLGNVEHVKLALDSLPDNGTELKKYLLQKDRVAALKILSSYKTKTAEALKKFLQLKSSDMLTNAELFSEGKTNNALDEIKKLSNILNELGYDEYIAYDFSLVPDFDYYSGLVFEVYVEGVGLPIASGGRYDNLLPSLGQKIGAAGFAIGLERLHLALVNQKQISTDRKTRIIFLGKASKELFSIAEFAREKNIIAKITTEECADSQKLFNDWEAKWLVRLEKNNLEVTNLKETKKMSVSMFKRWVENA